ncbi:hypothetical protein ACHAXT_008180 [Thalassiosira profunda]
MAARFLAASLVLGLNGGSGANAFASPRSLYFHTHHTPITVTPTSTSRFAGGGFGVSKAPSKKKEKNKKGKSKSGLLGDLDVATAKQQSAAAPKLDRFGLPLPTEDDVFPPLGADITRIPAEYGADGYKFNREEVTEAMENHLGVNLDAFDDDGQSTHTEQDGESRWSLRLLHKDPPAFRIDNFFTEEECVQYMAMVDPKEEGGSERPNAVQMTSPTFAASLSISKRTSTTWFCRYEGVPTLLAKVKRLLNVDLSQFEEPQIVRYRTGEEFSWHEDAIPSAQLENGGQRLATLLVYLNDMEEGRGGGTIFRDLEPPRTTYSGKEKGRRKRGNGGGESNSNQLAVRPKTGTALLFFPAFKDGRPDARTLHKGEMALDRKMIAQLWIHEREYNAGVPGGNRQSDAKEGVEKEEARLGF